MFHFKTVCLINEHKIEVLVACIDRIFRDLQLALGLLTSNICVSRVIKIIYLGKKKKCITRHFLHLFPVQR